MNFQSFDRLPILEWASWWDKTIARWREDGLPSSLQDRYELCRHFGMDIYYQHWFPSSLPGLPEPSCHGAGIISTLDDYKKIRPLLFPQDKSILLDKRVFSKWAKEQRSGDAVIWFTLEGFFWFPRRLLGIEPHLYSFYDQPELLHTINEELADYHIHAINTICEECQPEFMSFAEDLSYNNGPMLSEEHFDQFLLPYYKKLIPYLKERGILAFVDSDGDLSKALPWFERAGVDGLLPLERQSGLDLVCLREKHPGMRFLGGFDKMCMSKGELAMRAEFERLLPVASQGGFILGCDHQTPPEVSLQNYRIYLRLFHEYAQKAAC